MKELNMQLISGIKMQLLLIALMVLLNHFTHAQLNYNLKVTSDKDPQALTFTLQGVSHDAKPFIAIFRDSILEPNIITNTEMKISAIPDEELDLILGMDSVYSATSKENYIRNFEIIKNHRKCTGSIYSGSEVSAVIREMRKKNLIYLSATPDIAVSRTLNGMIIFLSADSEWDFNRK